MPNNDTSHSSYIRLIPLIMALVLSVASFGFSFWANRTVLKPLFFWLNGGVVLAAAVLVSLTFGYTYQTYRSAIFKACQAVNSQSVRCASLAPKVEVILLAVALGLLVLASALFGCVRQSDSSETTDEIYIDEKLPSSKRQSTFLQAIQRNSVMKSSSHLSEASTASKEPAMYGASAVDESLEAWRDVAILDGHEQPYHYQQEQQINTNPLRPPPATGGRRSNEYAYKNHNANGYDRRHSSNSRAYPTTSGIASSSPTSTPPSPTTATNYYTNNGNEKRRQRHGSSSSSSPRQENNQHYQQYELSNQSDDLLPPTLPFADHHPQQRRKNSSPQSANQPRPTSHASGNTFGAHEMLMEDSPSSSAFTLDDQHHQPSGHYGGRQYSDASFRTATPTSYHYDRSDSHDSICFTPTFNDRSSSGISMTSQHIMQQQQQQQQYRRTSSPTALDARRKSSGNVTPTLQQHPSSARYYHDSASSPRPSDVPTLQTPPSSRHPLNHKVIKDERIGAYFQHPSNRNSPSS
ncbi:unnamed protein product [Absidia cylindrospora]